MDTQEVSRFVTEQLVGPLEPALTRAIGACAIFMTAVTVGYLLPIGSAVGGRLAGVGRSTTRINAKLVIAACLGIGLLAQVLIIGQTGGLGAAANDLQSQKTLKAGFILYLMASFGTVCVLIWAAWRRPGTATSGSSSRWRSARSARSTP